MKSEQSIEWQFGAWSGLSPLVGWGLLAIVAIAGVALTFYLYRGTLRPLSFRKKLSFGLLRAGFLVTLLICLAGPVRVERSREDVADARPLAIVIDDSASMTTPDARQTSRLSLATRSWKKVEPEATRAFGPPRVFSLSKGASLEGDLATAIGKPAAANSTALYETLDKIIADAPPGGYAGLVCLTDGLDTTDARMDGLIARAVQSHVPLYFASGDNQRAARESLLAREVVAPGQVLRKSTFNVSTVIEARSAREREIPVSLWRDGQPLAETKVRLRRGPNLISWSAPVEANEPGLTSMELRVGEGAEMERTALATRVVDKEAVNVLFYQGSLDWGFRFINKALQRDKSFAVTSLFDPAAGLQPMWPAENGAAPMVQLPDSVNALSPYQIVVLANVFAEQISPVQQRALIDYVRGGGGLLFIVSDTKGAQTFAGAEMESMLPVIFEHPPAEVDHGEQALRDFQRLMKSVGGSNGGNEAVFVNENIANSGLAPLKNFALPPGPKGSPVEALFGRGLEGQRHRPQFADYARVAGIKAGGEVLAVHPDDRGENGDARALLVTQRFGQGQATVLLTDALWRWKLSLPSDAPEPELFWQQLFLALARRDTSGLKFTLQPYFVSLGQKAQLRVEGVVGMNSPKVTATSPSGAVQPIVAQAGATPRSWIFEVAASEAGKWRVRVEDARGSQTETLVRVSAVGRKDEMSDLPPDLDGMRQMAEATGGAMLGDGAPGSWSAPAPAGGSTLKRERVQPLWNGWPVLLLCLGFYTAELVWRRRAKLL